MSKGKYAARRYQIKHQDMRSICGDRAHHVPTTEGPNEAAPVMFVKPNGHRMFVPGWRTRCLHCGLPIETHEEDINRYGSYIWRISEYIIEELPG